MLNLVWHWLPTGTVPDISNISSYKCNITVPVPATLEILQDVLVSPALQNLTESTR